MRRAVLLGLVLALAVPAYATVTAGRATVAVTATVIYSNASASPVSIGLINQCASSVYLGGSGVTTSDGLELSTLSSISIRLAPSEIVYGIVASSTCRVDWIKAGI